MRFSRRSWANYSRPARCPPRLCASDDNPGRPERTDYPGKKTDGCGSGFSRDRVHSGAGVSVPCVTTFIVNIRAPSVLAVHRDDTPGSGLPMPGKASAALELRPLSNGKRPRQIDERQREKSNGRLRRRCVDAKVRRRSRLGKNRRASDIESHPRFTRLLARVRLSPIQYRLTLIHTFHPSRCCHTQPHV